MAEMTITPRKPVHRLAWIAFTTALIALPLAWYGSLHAEKNLPNSPLRTARNFNSKPAEPGPWYEKLWVRSETAILGATIDQRVLALTERSKVASCSVEVIAFGLPFFLGIGAALLGASAMKAIEKSRDRYLGNFQAVTAIMMGGFSSVIAGCMIFSIHLWPHMPSLYTR